MITAVADTHTVIWYLLNDDRLSARARDVFEGTLDTVDDQIGVAAISLVEIVYLVEKGRVPRDALDLLNEALNEDFSVMVEVPFDRRIAMRVELVDRAIVRDMPDRIIAATAYSCGVPLITKDDALRKSNITTIW